MSDIEVGPDTLTDEQLRARVLLTAWVSLHGGRDRFAGYVAVPNGPPISMPRWRLETGKDGGVTRCRLPDQFEQPTIGQEVLLPEGKGRTGERLLFESVFNIEEWCVDLLGLGATPSAQRTEEHAHTVSAYTHRMCYLALKLEGDGLLQLRVQRNESFVLVRDVGFDWSGDPPNVCWAYTYPGLLEAKRLGAELGWERAPHRAAVANVRPIEVRA